MSRECPCLSERPQMEPSERGTRDRGNEKGSSVRLSREKDCVSLCVRYRKNNTKQRVEESREVNPRADREPRPSAYGCFTERDETGYGFKPLPVKLSVRSAQWKKSSREQLSFRHWGQSDCTVTPNEQSVFGGRECASFVLARAL